VFAGDLPIVDKALPRFLDDAAAAKLLRTSAGGCGSPRPPDRGAARPHRHALERTSGAHHRCRRPDRLGLLAPHPGRQAPHRSLHPSAPGLKDLLDDWITHHRPAGLRSDRLLLERRRPLTALRIATALRRLGTEAGIGHVTAHQLRHTLATQAINRGMSLDAIAALLGHKTLAMTMVYARIADKTVADEYFAVTEKVEALYHQPRQLPAEDEGTEMRRLRAEMHRRMLGNGYCARPVEMDCHFESICESCNFLRHHHRVSPHTAAAT
jgi:integrase/recombinase XerD